jgi:hypothetical protein
MHPLTATNQNKKMETDITDKQNTPASGLHEPTCSALARHLNEQQDAAIRQAINNHLRREDWSLEKVKTRLALCSYQGSDLQTITMDGEPIMSIGPVEINTEKRGRSTFLRVTRGYRVLNEPNATGHATADNNQPKQENGN